MFPHRIETDTREPLFTYNGYGFLWISIGYWMELIVMVIACLCISAVIGRYILYRYVIEPKLSATTTAYLIGFGLIIPFWVYFPFLVLSSYGNGIIDIRNNIFRFLVCCISPVVCCFRTIECICGFVPSYATASPSQFLLYYSTVPIVARVKRHRHQQQQQPEPKSKSKSKSKLNQLEPTVGDTVGENNTTITSSSSMNNIGDPIKCTVSKSIQHLGKFVGWLFLTGLVQSILNQHRYFAVFGGMILAKNDTNADTDSDTSHDDTTYDDYCSSQSWYALERMLTWELYANSAIQAILFQLYLTTYCEGLTFGFTVLTGYEAEPVMDNPILKSSSPSDFWGRRWNMIVHTVLKNGVYKPVRKYYSRSVAVLATFLASGIFHEWILLVLFFDSPSSGSNDDSDNDSRGINNNTKFQPVWGSSIVFFLWQAMLIGFEIIIGKSKFVQTIGHTLPQPIRTAIIIAMGLPMAHFFLDPYIRSEAFFTHGSIGLPMIVPISS